MNILIALMIILPAIAAVISTAMLKREYEKFTDNNRIKKNEENAVRAKYYILIVLPMLNVLFGLVIALMVNSYFTGADISRNVGLPCGVLAGTMAVSALAAAFCEKRGMKTGALTDEGKFRSTLITVIVLELVIIIGLFFLVGKILGVY